MPSYDWADCSREYIITSALKWIKKICHFRFCAYYPGVVFVCSACDASKKGISLLKYMSWRSQPMHLPSMVKLDGLLLKREWHLYDKISLLDVQDLV